MSKTPSKLEDRLAEWLEQPGAFITPSELAFITSIRQYADLGVGYGWMQQIIEWEWASKHSLAWGPEHFQKKLDGLERELAAAQAQNAGLEPDAARYRLIRDLFNKSVSGGIEVNDARLGYEDPPPNEAVRLYWYPDTPIGFYEVKADTLDATIDAARKEGK